MHPKKIRVVLVDDHPIVIEGIRGRLSGVEGIDIVGTYTSARDLIRALGAAGNPADLAIVDFSLGPQDVDGVNLLRSLRTRFGDLAILVLSSHFNPATVSLALQAGANGFLSKGEGADELLVAIHAVTSGKTYLSGAMRQQLADLSGLRAQRDALPQGLAEPLTPREHEVLRCILDGMSTTEISAKFSRAVSTISTQKKSGYQKLGIRTDAELFKVRALIEKTG